MKIKVDTSINRKVSLCFNSINNGQIDWGDGYVYNIKNGVNTHNYTKSQEYTITVSGSFDCFGWVSYSPRNVDAIIAVDDWGDHGIKSLSYAFEHHTNLTRVPDYLPSSVVRTCGMFFGATSFNQDISAWDTDNVTDMSYMFCFATNFDQDIGAWNTANVTDMSYMFSDATSFNQDIGAWNTGKVRDMDSMLDGSGLSKENYPTWFKGE